MSSILKEKGAENTVQFLEKFLKCFFVTIIQIAGFCYIIFIFWFSTNFKN